MKIVAVVVIMGIVILGCVKIGPGELTPEMSTRLIKDYPALYENMIDLGCPTCHTTGRQKIANKFRLPPPGENDGVAVQMLWERLDTTNVAASKLVRKPNGEVNHRGGKILNPPKRERWIQELVRWYRS